MHMSNAGLNLLKSFESCKLTSYKGKGEAYYTIGWGHCGPEVKQGMRISQAHADELLKQDLIPREQCVNKYVKSFKPNQNQFDALVDYTYNRGVKGLKQLCDNSKTAEDFSKNILVYWGTNQAVKAGIMRRRKAEKQLFDKPVSSSTTHVSETDVIPTTILRYGNEGAEVSWLQCKLILHGYDIVVDGKFGKNTLAAVKDFQGRYGLVVDGEVGPKTINKLI